MATAERKLPERVPVLKGSDFCRGTFEGSDGTHCMLGWVHEVVLRHAVSFGFESSLGDMRSEICESLIAELSSRWGFEKRDLVGFNDSPEMPKAELARLWNKTFANRLGYSRVGREFILSKKGSN